MDTYSKRCQEGRLIANDSRGLSVDVERAIDASRATGTEQELAHTRGREVQCVTEGYAALKLTEGK